MAESNNHRNDYRRFTFTLQWHLTNKCEMRCRHCYIPHENKKGSSESLSYDNIISVIDNFSDLIERWQINGRINFSGGNPILRNDFFNIAEYTNKQGIKIGILGNPISDNKLIEKLKEVNVYRYQISFEGLEKTNDAIRGKGSFAKGINFLIELKKYDIPRVVMTTVSKQNIEEIPELAKYLYEKGLVEIFDFARLVPVGEAKKMKKLMPTAQKYKKFMYSMYESYLELKEKGIIKKFGTKEPLWNLLFKEIGLLQPKNNDKISNGCLVGMNGITIDVDGQVYSCRRLEEKIGNIKMQSLEEIFIYSKELNRQREYERINKCGSCDLMTVCRGCRAVAKAFNGNYFDKDPQCWK